MKYKTICFDVDGTLYDKKLLNKIGGRTVFMHPFFAVKYSDTRYLFREIQDDFEKYNMLDLSFGEREAKVFSMILKKEKSIEEARRMLDKHYYNTLQRQFRKMVEQPETVKLFKVLKENNIKIGVLSDWPLYDKLERIGVADLVDYKISTEQMLYLKPSKHCFEYLINTVKMNKEEVLYVGDSYEKDIVGAKTFGIDAILINSDKKADECPLADKVFPNWDDFALYVRKMVEEK